MEEFDPANHPAVRRKCKAGLLLAAILLVGQAGWSPSLAQTVDEVKDAMEIMVSSSAICGDYLKRPELLENTRQLAREQLGKVGLSEADADAFSDQIAAEARQETNTEMQQQVACEIINIPAIK